MKNIDENTSKLIQKLVQSKILYIESNCIYLTNARAWDMIDHEKVDNKFIYEPIATDKYIFDNDFKDDIVNILNLFLSTDDGKNKLVVNYNDNNNLKPNDIMSVNDVYLQMEKNTTIKNNLIHQVLILFMIF